MNAYFECPNELLDRMITDRRLAVADFRILFAAMANTDVYGDTVGLSIAFLVKETRLHRSTVIRSRRKLAHLGYLRSEGKGKRGLARFAVTAGDSGQ